MTQVMVILPAHRKSIVSVCLSRDESLAASAEEGSSQATIWDLATETAAAQCRGVKRLQLLCFSQNDSILRVLDDSYPQWNHAWSVGGGSVRRLEPTEYEMAEECGNRPLLVKRSGTRGKERLKICGDSWRTAQETFGMPKLREVRRVGPSFVVGPNSHYANTDIVIRPLIDTDPQEVRTPSETPLDADVGRCWSAAITDDHRLVALGFDNGLVYLHDFAHDRELARWHWDIGPVKALAFSPTGRKLIAGGKGTLAVWELRPRQAPDEDERGLLEAVAGGESHAVSVYSDFLEERGAPRWDRYEWKSPRPLQMHAQALLQRSDR